LCRSRAQRSKEITALEEPVSKKVLIGIAAIVSLALVAACGDKKEEKSGAGGGSAAKPTAASPEGPAVTLDKATAGTIKGKITFANAPDKLPAPIDMGAKAAECGTASAPKTDEYYIVGENNAAANVLVFVKSGPAKNVKGAAASTAEVDFDQTNCMYHPRVVGMRAGQPVRFKSSDPTSHNIHLVSRLNGEWNATMSAKSSFLAGETTSQPVTNAEFPPITLKCDIHTWMRAYLAVFSHDYFRVTTKDGMYELKDLPPGEYEIEVWHERAKAKAQKVTVGPKETKDLDFALKFE
jgi:plastocyanin